MSQRQYRALAFVAIVFQIAGVLVIVLSFFAAISIWLLTNAANNLSQTIFVQPTSTTTQFPAFMIAIVVFIIGIIYGIALFAFGELIQLLRHMAQDINEALEHQRATAYFSRETANLLKQSHQSAF